VLGKCSTVAREEAPQHNKNKKIDHHSSNKEQNKNVTVTCLKFKI
jgi:hypothetical protein